MSAQTALAVPCPHCGDDQIVEFRDPDVGEMPCPVCKPDEAIRYAQGVTLSLLIANTDREESDVTYAAKVRDQLAAGIGEGHGVAVFERRECAVCMDCRQVLQALPLDLPAPDAAVYRHECREQPSDSGGDA